MDQYLKNLPIEEQRYIICLLRNGRYMYCNRNCKKCEDFIINHLQVPMKG